MSDIGGGQQAADIENDPANQQLIADQQAAAAAGNVDGGDYPRVNGAGETWTDPVDGRTITGTQYTYNTEAEAVAAIDTARANGKDVLYMDPDNASYIAANGDNYTITIED